LPADEVASIRSLSSTSGQTDDVGVPAKLDFGTKLTRLVPREIILVIFGETASIDVHRWTDSSKRYCNKLEYIERTKGLISSVYSVE
jgi:hypothetical protein